ncbi:hypothetical protein ACIGKQ_22250 [Gordonia sp. NPDC062954]|uniref:hypothetical protein n=1 Tax=Gordonia sp. NPDC062954 TaxID=3364003 RepID=UPI0037CA809F
MTTPWPDARRQLADATCLWQDLDGLHCTEAPETAPMTSILWGWWPEAHGQVVRVRLDGDKAYVAVRSWPTNGQPTVPWSRDDRRVAAAVRANMTVDITQKYAVAVIDEMTFIRPI